MLREDGVEEIRPRAWHWEDIFTTEGDVCRWWCKLKTCAIGDLLVESEWWRYIPRKSRQMARESSDSNLFPVHGVYCRF